VKRLLPSAAMLALVLVVSAPALGQRPVAMVDCVFGGRCIGTNGHDTITATNRRDVIFAHAGNDTVRARGGNDTIYGGPGRDRIFAGTGQDFINVRNDASRDFVSCGPGFDTVNNMPGPGPADSFAGDCEEFVQ
jgi:hypothetical protein